MEVEYRVSGFFDAFSIQKNVNDESEQLER